MVRLRITAVAALALAVTTQASAQAARGHLVIIGGGARPPAVVELIVRLAGGAEGTLLVFPQASAEASTGPDLEREFRAAGVGRVVVVATDRRGADTDAVLDQTRSATGAYFAGGDQTRLMAVLLGTRLERRLHELYENGAVMAGTSAGAAVMSRVMITGDERRPYRTDDNWQSIEADNVVTATGLGFLDDVIVDQHFVRRRRHNRLISLVLEQPRLLGVAIDEETATWVKPDRSLEVVGNGPVLVIDANGATAARDASGQGLRGAGLRMHVLRAGSIYDLASRTVRRLGP